MITFFWRWCNFCQTDLVSEFCKWQVLNLAVAKPFVTKWNIKSRQESQLKKLVTYLRQKKKFCLSHFNSAF